MNELDQHRYFFDSGIRFQCRRCGACCTGAPGVIRVSDEEAVAIADFLSLPVQQAIDTLLYPWENGYSVREDGDGRCLFYEEGCRIYPVRPRQCRTFPFWTAILRSEARWDSIRRHCPGIGKGRLFAKHEILDILNS
ncbi:YkgJ family cysteine cluster protein [uncultured Desulfosarcina sp.]|uniref:YkgJ family cysteine cluster protein n=1 Tax=uncultured Desulfosarcina sp. TaxID=218289 RepID=UPI0029C94A45|nr:YkgJ family cysteine cluster protein [uncultured Desulfosarcina sp.]